LTSRKLTASGYSIGQKLNIRGLEATCLKNQSGESLLFVSNVFFGPSWAQIFKTLEHLVPAPKLISLGYSPAVLIADSEISRNLLAVLLEEANASRGKQVHLEGVGFVELDSKARRDPRTLALPLVSIVSVVALGIVWTSSQRPSQSVEVSLVTKECIVDSNRSEFDRWLIETLSSEPQLGLGQEISKGTIKGQLNVVIESTIGSAAKVTGTALCSDGRQRAVNHRVDISGSGAVLELGQ